MVDMKPKEWTDCPNCILELFLENVELMYDPYESSKAEAIDSILNGNVFDHNKHIISSCWAVLSEEDFQRYVQHARERALNILKEIEARFGKHNS
jgi:hypothetical protein